MSNSQGSSGRQPPQDDRTLLDPLNAEELKALREARQRLQQQKKGSAVAHQLVVGPAPDAGEDIGSAPTRATPSLPAFDSRGTSIDNIHAHTIPVDVASARPSDPASMPPIAPTAPTVATKGTVPAASGKAPTPSMPSSGPAPAPGGDDRRPAAFGENTLLWMQPPKLTRENRQATAGVTTADLMLRPAENRMRRVKAIAAVATFVLIFVALVLVSSKTDRGTLELHTTPPKAKVIIDGHAQSEVSPVKLTLPVGKHEIRLELSGHKPTLLDVDVKKGEEVVRQEVDLEPISEPGLMTVAIAVQPVAARITVNGQEFLGKRTVMIPNLDPKKAHKIVVEAGGYVKAEQEIPADELRANYTFVLQRDADAKMGE